VPHSLVRKRTHSCSRARRSRSLFRAALSSAARLFLSSERANVGHVSAPPRSLLHLHRRDDRLHVRLLGFLGGARPRLLALRPGPAGE
jgi:hypothetical protein